MNNKRLASNMIVNIIAFGINILVSFLLSPYIVSALGSEAYGFISLINNFISMSQVVTIAFNSMGARFITIAIHQNNEKKAQQYFSSLFFANLIIGIVILGIFGIVSLNVEKIFDVPFHLIHDIKKAFIISGIAFSVALTFSVLSVSTYAMNRLDLSALRDMTKQIVRASAILFLFIVFNPSVTLVSIASVIMEIYCVVVNFKVTKKIFPGYKIKASNFSFQAIKDLVSSGIWNSVDRLSYVLIGDLDLMVANIFISATIMGTLSISKTIPAAVNQLVNTVVAIFIPTFTIKYAQSDIEGLLKELKKAVKVVSVFIAPVLCFLLAFGMDFYRLWQPTQDPTILQTLSILAILPIYFTLGMKSINNIFTVTNKLFLPTMVSLVSAILTIIVEFILLKSTSLGVYAIAATSSVFMIIRCLTFIPIYAAKCLQVKWYTFYPNIIKEFIVILISAILTMGFSKLVIVTSWIELILFGILTYIFVVIINLVFNFRHEDYIMVISKIKNKLSSK